MTSNTSRSHWVGRICRVYAVMLCAYPKAFRIQFGREMRQVFRHSCRDAATNNDLVRFVLRMFWDGLCTFFSEWLAVLRTLEIPITGWWLLALRKAARHITSGSIGTESGVLRLTC